MVDFEEEREVGGPGLGVDGGLESGLVWDVEEGDGVDGGHEGVEAGEDGGVGCCGGGCQAGAGVGL